MTLFFYIIVALAAIFPLIFGKSGDKVSIFWHTALSLLKSILFIALFVASIHFFGIDNSEKTNRTETTTYIKEFMCGVEDDCEYAYYVDTTNVFHKVAINECEIIYDTIGESYITTVTSDAKLSKYGRQFINSDNARLKSYYKETIFHIHKADDHIGYDTIQRIDTIYVVEHPTDCDAEKTENTEN